MPTVKQSSTSKTTKAASSGSKVVQVQKGSSSTVTKEAVKAYADQHRAAMIRLANR